MRVQYPNLAGKESEDSQGHRARHWQMNNQSPRLMRWVRPARPREARGWCRVGCSGGNMGGGGVGGSNSPKAVGGSSYW